MQNWHPPQTIHDQSEMLQGMTDLERYFEGRDKVVPYTPPETGQVQPAPVVTLEMKRYFAAGGFTTFCVVVIAAAEQGAFAAAATVGGYIAFVGAGIGLAWIVLKSCFTWSPSDGNAGETQHSASPQNINVTVNVAGQNVKQNSK